MEKLTRQVLKDVENLCKILKVLNCPTKALKDMNWLVLFVYVFCILVVIIVFKWPGGCCSENFKDVDVVCVLPKCSTSSTADPLAMEMVSDHILKHRPFPNSRIKSQEDISLDYDSGIDSITTPSSVFEFQKAERGLQRAGLAPFSKPAPSKWDDAQKWIASPTSNRTKNGQPHGQGGVGLRKNNQFGYGSRQTSMKFVVEVPDETLIPCEEAENKQMELSQGSRETGGPKLVTWEGDPYSSTNSYKNTIENCVKESASKIIVSVSLWQYQTVLLVLNYVESVQWITIRFNLYCINFELTKFRGSI